MGLEAVIPELTVLLRIGLIANLFQVWLHMPTVYNIIFLFTLESGQGEDWDWKLLYLG